MKNPVHFFLVTLKKYFGKPLLNNLMTVDEKFYILLFTNYINFKEC